MNKEHSALLNHLRLPERANKHSRFFCRNIHTYCKDCSSANVNPGRLYYISYLVFLILFLQKFVVPSSVEAIFQNLFTATMNLCMTFHQWKACMTHLSLPNSSCILQHKLSQKIVLSPLMCKTTFRSSSYPSAPGEKYMPFSAFSTYSLYLASMWISQFSHVLGLVQPFQFM